MNPVKLKTHEILELARLDALGMLDHDERVVFERAFQDASPALRDQIHREQNRLTDISDLLPDVDPPQDLRARVIGAVRDAMSAVTGRNAGDVLARIEPLASNMRRNVSPLWRAACIGFATATVVLMGLGFYVQSTYDDSLTALRDGELSAQIAREIGPQFVDTLLSPTAERVNFLPVADNAGRGGAVVLIDSETKLAFLVCKNLPKISGQYALVITDNDGQILQTLARFENSGQLKGRVIDGDITTGSRYAIYASETPSEPAKPVLVSL